MLSCDTVCGHIRVNVQYTRWFLFSTRVCALHSQLVGFTNYRVHTANSLAAHFIIGIYNLRGLSMGVMGAHTHARTHARTHTHTHTHTGAYCMQARAHTHCLIRSNCIHH